MRKRPARLQQGDTVGIITPASPPMRKQFDKSLEILSNLGLNYVVGEAVGEKEYYLAGTDELRVKDLHTMIADPTIKAIFCAAGGYGSSRILDQIDYLLLEENPKIFWGFSDITFLHSAFGMFSDIVTFHGPNLQALGDENVHERTIRMIQQLFTPAEIFYDETIAPLTTISGGQVRGQLVGGNLSSIVGGLGTKFELDVVNKIILIEEIGLEPVQIDAYLNQLRLSRKLEQCAGIIIGDFSKTQPREFKNSPQLAELFASYFSHLNKPVVSGFKFGHEQLNICIPLGVDVMLDADAKTLVLLPGVE